jgi:hypothetical protein
MPDDFEVFLNDTARDVNGEEWKVRRSHAAGCKNCQ